MVLCRVRVHPKGLGIAAQRKVYALRTTPGKNGKIMSWRKVAKKVKNLKGKTPFWQVCRDKFNAMNRRTGVARDHYANCGRHEILDAPLRKFLVQRLLALRKVKDVTACLLVDELAKKKKVVVSVSTVRRVLEDEGYKYLPRAKKPKYSKELRKRRVKFSKWILRMPVKKERETISLSLDGAVFCSPPTNAVERENWCRSDPKKVYRKSDEADLPELQGYDHYIKQAPPSRIVPVWGGLAAGGFAPILFHEDRKTDTHEWTETIRAGALLGALKEVNTRKKKTGPWTIICDGESFLQAKPCMQLYKKMRITLLQIPPKCPDLNPIEKFWGWTRKQMRARDLADLVAKRQPLGKTAYRERLKRLWRSARAQQVAKNIYTSLRSVCKRIVKSKGAAVRG